MQQKLKRMKKELTKKHTTRESNIENAIKKNKQQFLNDYFKNEIAKIIKFFFDTLQKLFAIII